MAGLPWIKVWTAIGDHPKVQRLERDLGIRDGLGMVIRLWCWTAEYHPDGTVPSEHLEAGVRVAIGPLRLQASKAGQALVTCGFLDPAGGGHRVHDWHEMQTKHVEADERRKAQARERQAKHRAAVAVVTRDVTCDGNVTSVTEKEKEREIEKKQKKRMTAPASPSPLPSPDFRLTQAALVETFLTLKGVKYLWQGAKDSEGLKRLLSLKVPLSELQARWRIGLRSKGWNSAKTIAQLAQKWNDLEEDPHDAMFRKLRDDAERELAEAGDGNGGGGREAGPVRPDLGQAPAPRTGLQAAVGELLDLGWTTGSLQDGPPLEPGPERR